MDNVVVDPPMLVGAPHTYSVRTYTMADIPQMVDIGAAFHQESGYSHVPFDAAKVARMFKKGVSDPYFFGMLITTWDDRIVGGLIARIGPYFFSDSIAAWDLMLIASEGKNRVISLVRAYIEWAKRFDVVEINLGTTTRVNTDGAERLFERLGFERVGSVWKMVP